MREQSDAKRVLAKVYLTETEQAMLDKITARRFPDRTRMQSVTVAELIREEYIRQSLEKPVEDE